LKNSFKRHAESLMPKAFELDHGDEMNKEQALKYYQGMFKSVFEKELTSQEKDKFWNGLKRKGKVNSDERIPLEEMLKENVEEWVNMTPMLADLQVTVYEVEETFPTMYNMQKVVQGLVSRISGVEQEQINW